MAMRDDIRKRATRVRSQFVIAPGVYVLGSLERGVTVYSQQVRAHNLMWALWELHKEDDGPLSIAVIGGGIGGLTTAAAALGLFRDVTVTVFERTWDLLPLQQGSDARWLHPRIYNWPEPESRFTRASLPLLDWQEGRASDVAHQVLTAFSEYCEKPGRDGCPRRCRLTSYLGVEHLRIYAKSREIEWVGREGIRDGHYFRAGAPKGGSVIFDVIVLAVGFGKETSPPDYPTPPYWQNESYGQPVRDGTRRRFLISGYGDGALVDLCRLTIERFRQDKIVYELFGSALEKTELELSRWLEKQGAGANLYALFNGNAAVLSDAENNLRRRIRKDTHVVLHLGGRSANTKLDSAFGNSSSVLNRLLLFLLFRCGAFVPSFEKLNDLAADHQNPGDTIICRHGADAMSHVHALFVDRPHVSTKLTQLQKGQEQKIAWEWEPGSFPT